MTASIGNKKIKAVIIGFAHMHVNEIARYIDEQPEIRLVGGADIVPETPELSAARYTRAWNLANVSGSYNMTQYDDYIQMLEIAKPDVAFILAENHRKPGIVLECAKRGIDVIIEKPMAISLPEALKISDAVTKYNIRAMVNWPTTWRPYVYKLKKALDSGITGSLLKMHYLNGHTGPLGVGARHRGVSAAAEVMTDVQREATWWYKAERGGGVLLDIGCYGCMYSRYFNREQAIAVSAYAENLNTPYADTFDNAGAFIKYPHSVSVVEATWTTPNQAVPSGPVLYCSDGVLSCTKSNDGLPGVAALDIYGRELAVPDTDYPEHMKNAPAEYVHHLVSEEPFFETLTIENNLKVMAILDTFIKSAGTGKEEAVPRI